MLWSPVGWSADGLVFAYGFTHIHVSTADQRSSRTLPGQSLRWSPHGHTLATSDMVSVALWDLDRGITTVLPDSGGIRLGWSPAFCWANTTTVRGATDTLITTWDVNGTIITQHPLAPAFSTDSIFARPIPMWSPDGNLLATWIDHEVAIVGHDGTPHAIVPTSTMGAFASPVAWHPTSRMIATVDDWNIQLWDLNGNRRHTFTGEHYGIASLAWSPDGRILATGSWDSTLCLWSSEGTLLQTIFTYPARYSSGAPFILAWSSDGRYLAASLRNCSVQLCAG